LAFPTSTAHRLAALVTAHRRWVVLAMLLALHAALLAEQGGAFQRIWLLVHFGLFLLWQPFIAAERELELFSAILLTIITGVTLYFMSGWLIVMWLLLLLGILGGRVFTVQAARRGRFYLAAFGYVLAILLLWAVPSLILGEQQIPAAITHFATTYLPFVLLLLVFLPISSENESVQVFDFFYAVLVFQLGLVLVLGSLVTMRYTNDDYVNSVVLTVLGFATGLFILAVFWNPTRGFGGLRTYFSTYLLSVGMPFELWMRRIAELAETEPDSSRFLEQALGEVASLPWMRGANWRSPDGEGSFGEAAGYATRFAYHDLELVFRTEDSLSPALFLHMRLLAQVVGEFYEGKRRENELRRNAYLQAVHETGARLTHDVKNLLQSLYALTSMAPKTQADGYDGLLRRQLPQLTKRLNATLEKLRAPDVATLELPVPAHAWWAELERRLVGSPVTLQGTIALERDVPGALFDSFVENGLENARAKAGRDGTVGMRVDFSCDERGVELSVVDSGSPVPDAVTRKLFREPIERAGSLGIGLYNAARQATRAGYTLLLADNREGNVCFRLRRTAGASAESAQRQG
jgi:hypothetical protein